MFFFQAVKLCNKILLTATVEMLNCPVGTLRTTEGAGAVTDCEPCPAGYYCLEESSVTNGACLEGYYCPTNFTNPYGNNPPYIGSYGNDMVSSKGETNNNKKQGK